MDRYREEYYSRSERDRDDRRRSFVDRGDSPTLSSRHASHRRHHHDYEEEEDDRQRHHHYERKRRHRSWSDEGVDDSYYRSSRRRRESSPRDHRYRRRSPSSRSHSHHGVDRSRRRRRSDRYPSHELIRRTSARYEDDENRRYRHRDEDSRHDERRRDDERRREDGHHHYDRGRNERRTEDDSYCRRRQQRSPPRQERRRPSPAHRYSASPASRRYDRRPTPPSAHDRKRGGMDRRWDNEDRRWRDDDGGERCHHHAPSPQSRRGEPKNRQLTVRRPNRNRRRRRNRNRRQQAHQQRQGSPAARAAPLADSDHSSQRTNDEPRPISDDDDDVALETPTVATNPASSTTASKKSSKKSKKQHHDDDSASRDDSVGHFRGGPGTMIKNRYRVDRQVGMGTFGRVLECLDLQQARSSENRLVAIKVVRKVRRYYDSAILEADIVKRVNRKGGRGMTHVGVLLESFTYQDHYCMVFEALGFSLYDFMKRHNYQPFPMLCLKDIARQLLETVEFLHSFKLIHTDLKPENILLLNYRETTTKFRGRTYVIPELPFRVKVIDFGGATYDDEPKSRVVNTRQYRAPEVILAVDGEWSLPSDLWSAGCILAELYVGDLLFATHDNVEHLALMEQIIGPFSKGFIKRANHVELVGQAFDLDKGCRHRFDLHKNSLKFVRKAKPLEQLIMPEDNQFLKLLRSILVIDPLERATAEECCRTFRL